MIPFKTQQDIWTYLVNGHAIQGIVCRTLIIRFENGRLTQYDENEEKIIGAYNGSITDPAAWCPYIKHPGWIAGLARQHILCWVTNYDDEIPIARVIATYLERRPNPYFKDTSGAFWKTAYPLSKEEINRYTYQGD